MKSFVEKVQKLFADHGLKYQSPYALLEQWQEFVGECEDGYNDCIYEYYNDISSRKLIDLILKSFTGDLDESLNSYIAQVKATDEKFRSLLKSDTQLKDKSNWFEGGVLKFAGKEYGSDLNRIYGIEVEIKES
jgi:hypothetical protein